MKLKTSVRLARIELGLAVLAVTAAIYASLLGHADRFLGRLSMVVFFGSLCFAAWKRLARKRARLTELGPDTLDDQPLWTSPRIGGAVGVALLVAALVIALVPALSS